MQAINGMTMYQFKDPVYKSKTYLEAAGVEMVAHPKGGYYLNGVDLGLESTGAPETPFPQWVVDEFSNCIGKIMTEEDWIDTRAVHEAFQYARDTTGLTGEAFANSSQAKEVFYQRYADNLAGKNDLSNFKIAKGVRMNRVV